MLMRADESFLLVIDMQTRLAPAISSARDAIANASVLIRAAERLEIPVLAFEQYPKGLGSTVPELRELLPDEAVLEKIHFSCVKESRWTERLDALKRRQAILVGMETHVCVLQAAISLREEGYAPFVVADAMSSRRSENHRAGLDRMRSEGVAIVTTEMVVFEWLERGDTEQFRDLLELIK